MNNSSVERSLFATIKLSDITKKQDEMIKDIVKFHKTNNPTLTLVRLFNHYFGENNISWINDQYSINKYDLKGVEFMSHGEGYFEIYYYSPELFNT